MILFDKLQVIEGLSVYDDENNSWNAQEQKFYVIPGSPRFRLNDKKQPIFKFLKYRFPVDRPDGKKGGGALIFDVEFAVSEDKLAKVRAVLQEQVNLRFKNANPKPRVVIGQLQPVSDSPIGKPSCTIQVLGGGGTLVDKVQNFGRPALYGNFVSAVMVELTPEGATLAEQALQGKGAGIVQVVYSLPMIVRTPPIKATVDFWASKFMSFHQEVNVGRNIWGTPRSRKERISEFFSSHDYAKVWVDPGMVTDQKIVSAVTDWAWGTLEKAVTSMVLKDIDPVKDDQRKVDESLNHLTRDIMVTKMVDFHRVYEGKQAMAWDPTPQGTLEVITAIPGVKWADYAMTIDLDDPFFKQLNLNIQANADFQNLPIHSIDVHVEYPKSGGRKEVKDFNLKSPNEVGKFNTFIDNNSWKYKYSYKVHYKNMTEIFQAPLRDSEETFLTIDVGGTGILTVDLVAGDLDFEQMRAAQVTLRYEPNGKPPVEQMFLIDSTHLQHRFQKVILQAVDKPYKYKVKYLMKDGKEFMTDWRPSQSENLMVNDVWNATRTVGIRARGDLDGKIDAILIDVVYHDAANKYTQSKSIALTKDNKFFDWTFPVIDETGGKITYSGTIKYLDNSEETIPKTETTDNTILAGPKVTGFVDVQVLPDLIDWTLAKLVKVSLQYTDSANGINAKKDFIFKEGVTDPGLFKVELKDKAKTAYQWQASFFMQDGSTKKIDPTMTEEQTLVLQVPN
jgi:hypothetical protein